MPSSLDSRAGRSTGHSLTCSLREVPSPRSLGLWAGRRSVLGTLLSFSGLGSLEPQEWVGLLFKEECFLARGHLSRLPFWLPCVLVGPAFLPGALSGTQTPRLPFLP